jgi:thiol-disulfide isomerase/thioredoxin
MLLVVFVVVGAGIAAYVSRPVTDPRREGGVAVLDTPFPGLQGEAVVGPDVDTASMDWSVLVVNVWATWCLPCREEQPALLAVQREYADSGVTFVGIDYRDDRAAAERWVEDFDVSYPSLFDPDGRTAVTLDYPFVPDTLLVDTAGTTRYAIYGETNADELSRLLDDLLREQGNAVDVA